MEGIIKTLKLRELVGYGDLDKAVWPVTSTGAIFSSDNKSLEEILADLYSKIKNGGSGTGGNTGGNGGNDGKTYDYIPVFIYCHADSVPTSKPIGGSYNFTTNTLTPPSGWQNNYTGLDKPIYMSIGMACSKDGSTIEWSYPFVAFSDGSKGSDLPYQPVPESNYKTLFIYQHNTSQPDIPTGGSYSFDTQTLNPPDGWYTSKENLTYPVYMSVGFTSKDKNTIEWSYPVIIADKNGLGPGKNPDSALLKMTYVAVIYKQSAEQPNTPSASAGIVHFDTTPYTFDPPIGWSTDTALAVNDDTWCSIKAFYQTADNSYDNSATEWSTPVKANLTKLTLTEAEMDMIAGRISVTSNDVETAFDTWINNTRNLETIAEKVTETTDFYSLTAGQLVTNSDFQLNVAKELITVSNYKDDVVQNASGEIVAEIKADSDGMLTEIAKNVVIEAKADKDNKDGLIMLVAKDVTDNIKSEIEVGTDDSGNGFIKAIANSIDFNSNSFKSIVTNATNGKVTAIMQDDDTISLIKKAANDKVTSLIMGDDYIKMVASKVDIVGSLNTIDLTINGGKSRFNADGSGYVANQNISWDTDGNLNMLGKITATSLFLRTLNISGEKNYVIKKDNLYVCYLINTLASNYNKTESITLPDARELDDIEISIIMVGHNGYIGLLGASEEMDGGIKVYAECGINYTANMTNYGDIVEELTGNDESNWDQQYIPYYKPDNYITNTQMVRLEFTGKYTFKSIAGSWEAIEGKFMDRSK